MMTPTHLQMSTTNYHSQQQQQQFEQQQHCTGAGVGRDGSDQRPELAAHMQDVELARRLHGSQRSRQPDADAHMHERHRGRWQAEEHLRAERYEALAAHVLQ